MSYFKNLWKSIFEPGVSPTLAYSAHVACALLCLCFVGLYIGTRSYHCLVLLAISLAMWFSLIWFLMELAHSRIESDMKNGKGDGITLHGLPSKADKAKQG
ncbi:V-ATPase assembly factor Pkr1 [Schizosaccharomyces japonicus yFS275]|uniref:V-ATPase assembly factor Pkr1 n=1 Tax=Schizosaccharomyces japonicus (strain yFS275 / FY16936) TaxID=402676 RepID=B6K4L1_SCHJY|nr:V-ATPase assembly factor Pkr1 [Schizosaccharomyces japonicus yFS275]EEB08418.1 V-ATPase assembly factor Pkr1 [Schizosaccharomyces japonicus yFS275]